MYDCCLRSTREWSLLREMLCWETFPESALFLVRQQKQIRASAHRSISCVKVESDRGVDSRRFALNGEVFTVNASVAEFVRVVRTCTISASLSHLAFTDAVAFVVSVPIRSCMAFQIGSSILASVHSCDSTWRKPTAGREFLRNGGAHWVHA